MSIATPLQEWANSHEPDDDLLYKAGYWDQIQFVRDALHPLFVPDYKDREQNPVQVISTHTSKSVLLPVYNVESAPRASWATDPGVRLTLRYNFFNWAVSVDAGYYSVPDVFGDVLPRPLVRLPGPPLDQDSYDANPVYYEGFPVDRCYLPYHQDQRRFSFHLSNRYELYVFCRLLTGWLP